MTYSAGVTLAGSAGSARAGSRAVAVAVLVAVFLVLHALQCATGLDGSRPAAGPAMTVVIHDAPASEDSPGIPGLTVPDEMTSIPIVTDGHHGPVDDESFALTACLILLVTAGVVLMGTLRRRVLKDKARRGSPLRVQGRAAVSYGLSQLCVSRT